MKVLQMKVWTRRSLVPRREKTLLLEMLCDRYPEFAPQKFNYYEPVSRVFTRERIPEAVDEWDRGFFWTRKHPRIEGDAWAAWGGPAPYHAMASIRFMTRRSDSDRIKSLAFDVSREFDADLAVVHAFRAEEFEFGRLTGAITAYDPAKELAHMPLTTHELRKSLPDIYWGTLFGQSYMNLFGRDRLLSTPAYRVEEVYAAAIYVQLSETPYDFEHDYPVFNGLRERAKQHLDCNAFFNPGLPADHLYNTPLFRLESERYYPPNGKPPNPDA